MPVLHDLGPLLWVARIGLLAAFVLHMGFTMNLVITNKKARKDRYYKYQNHRKESSLATVNAVNRNHYFIVYHFSFT